MHLLILHYYTFFFLPLVRCYFEDLLLIECLDCLILLYGLNVDHFRFALVNCIIVSCLPNPVCSCASQLLVTSCSSSDPIYLVLSIKVCAITGRVVELADTGLDGIKVRYEQSSIIFMRIS